MQDNVDYYLEKRLQSWGHWYVKTIEHGLGYPSISVVGKLKKDGGILSRSTAKPQIPSSPDAEEIDALLNELGRSHKDYADAIKIRYTSNQPVELEVKRFGISVRTFTNNIRLAKMWLLGRISK